MADFDWSQLLSLIPQAVAAKKGGAGGSAFMQGFQEGQARRRQELAQQQAQQAAAQRQQQQDTRQASLDQWGMMKDANAMQRADEETGLKRQGMADTEMQSALGRISEFADVPQAEQLMAAQAAQTGAKFGMEPGAYDNLISQLGGVINPKRKKQAQTKLEALRKQYDEQTLSDPNWNISMPWGGTLKYADLVKLADIDLTDAAGAVAPMRTESEGGVPTTERRMLAAFARENGTTPDQLTSRQIADFRRQYAASDDKPGDPNAASAAANIAGLREDLLRGQVQDAEDKRKQLSQADENRRQANLSRADTVLTELDLLTKRNPQTGTYEAAPGLRTISGRSAALTPDWAVNTFGAGSAAANALTSLKRLASEQIVELINDMKNQSKTGATGFGQLSGPELAILDSAANRLQRVQSEDQLMAALNDIRRIVEKVKREATGSGVNGRVAPNVAPSAGQSFQSGKYTVTVE